MNKYQLNFLKQIIVSVDGTDGVGDYELDNEGNLIIIQNENYNITSYTLKIKNKDISSVFYYINDWSKVNSNDDVISVPIDFNNPTKTIKIEFKNGLVDDFEINVLLKSADKDAWNIKHSREVEKVRIKNLGLVLNSDGYLSTVIFKPCCDEYLYTIVKWYAIGYSKGNYYNTISNHFLEEQKIQNSFYSNIECAFYVAAEITQFDKDGKELISSTIGFKS